MLQWIKKIMSLHDTDKNSMDRGSPKPNSPDQVIEGATKAHATASSHYDAGADSAPGVLQQRNKQFIANDGTNNRALFGYNTGLSTWGLFVSKPGFNADSEPNPANYYLNSSQDVLKVAGSGTSTTALSLGSTSSTNTISHGLGFIPGVIGFVAVNNNFSSTGVTIFPSYTSGRYMLLPNTIYGDKSISGSATTVLEPMFISNLQADTNNIYINTVLRTFDTAVTYTFTYQYYILQESITV